MIYNGREVVIVKNYGPNFLGDPLVKVAAKADPTWVREAWKSELKPGKTAQTTGGDTCSKI